MTESDNCWKLEGVYRRGIKTLQATTRLSSEDEACPTFVRNGDIDLSRVRERERERGGKREGEKGARYIYAS